MAAISGTFRRRFERALYFQNPPSTAYRAWTVRRSWAGECSRPRCACRPAGDEEAGRLRHRRPSAGRSRRAQAAWAVALLDDCEACADLRVRVTLEEAGQAGRGIVAHLSPATARRLRSRPRD
ncbi:MAG: hypothetical protein WKG07_45760 [Hymenobacter sp.]